jgi:ATP-dependent Clp protease ATP-binding subunit ClpA
MEVMRNDKLTSRFQNALADAQSLAVGADNQMLDPAHLLSALMDQQGGSLRPLLAKAGANLPKLKTELTAVLDRLPKVEGTPGEVEHSTEPMAYQFVNGLSDGPVRFHYPGPSADDDYGDVRMGKP